MPFINNLIKVWEKNKFLGPTYFFIFFYFFLSFIFLDFTTFTFINFADAFIQSGLQLGNTSCNSSRGDQTEEVLVTPRFRHSWERLKKGENKGRFFLFKVK